MGSRPSVEVIPVFKLQPERAIAATRAAPRLRPPAPSPKRPPCGGPDVAGSNLGGSVFTNRVCRPDVPRPSIKLPCRGGDLNPRPQDLSSRRGLRAGSMSPVLYQAEPPRRPEEKWEGEAARDIPVG